MSKIPNLEKCCENLFDGDVTIQEFITEYDDNQVLKAELFLQENPKYIESVPFPSEDAEYQNLIDTNDGARFLQGMIMILD